MSEVRTPCGVAPPLDGLPPSLRAAIAVTDGHLIVAAPLGKREAKQLRLALDEAAWQRAVDALLANGEAALPIGLDRSALEAAGLDAAFRLDAGRITRAAPIADDQVGRLRRLAERVWNRAIDRILGQQSLVASYPISRWGAILDGLEDGDEAALRALCELYRRPIARFLRRLLPARGEFAEPEDLLAWVLATGAHRRLRLRRADGEGYWFRGYLRRWALAYARHVERGANREEPLPTDDVRVPAPSTDLDAFDLDFATTLVDHGLDRLRTDAPQAWRATMLYGLGFGWSAIGRAGGEALSTAYERAQRQWAKLASYLKEHLLRDLAAGPGAAERELRALAPALQAALGAYLERHAVPVLERALASSDPVAVAAAARSTAALGAAAADRLGAALARAAESGPAAARAVAAEALAEMRRRGVDRVLATERDR